jgi:OFA family oxalate/formate antiporter-like MFS transporter
MALSRLGGRPDTGARGRWVQLALGILAMVMIANLQYGWTLFVNPIAAKFHWTKPAIQWAFALFVLTETWSVPLQGYLVDRYGPRLLVAAGGVLVGGAWIIDAKAASLTALYAGAIVGGIGAGLVYGMAVGNALKWFPDRRGFAAGLTAAGFGAGSALTILPIYNMIRTNGYRAAFFDFGLIQGAVVFAAAWFLRAPRKGEIAQVAVTTTLSQSVHDYTPAQMVRTSSFWMQYAMMTMVAAGGLMAVAQLGPMARDYNVESIPVSLFGVTLAALPFALSLDRVMNGITRPFFGWVSDQLGRENTMCIAFTLEGLAILALLAFARVPMLFVVLSGLVFFGWGEIFSLFPAANSDMFGRKFATANYGVLYTAKGTASLLVPLGSVLQAATGSWTPIYVVAIGLDFAAAALALFALKPLAAGWVRRSAVPARAAAALGD